MPNGQQLTSEQAAAREQQSSWWKAAKTGLVAAGLTGIVATGIVMVSGAPVTAAVTATVVVGLAVTYACKRGMDSAREAVAAELKQSKQSESQLEKIMKEA
jgi:hypothetical protein